MFSTFALDKNEKWILTLMQFELTKEFLQEISSAHAEGNQSFVAQNLAPLHSADIAEILDQVEPEEAAFIYNSLEDEQASDVLVELEDDSREALLSLLSAKEIAGKVDSMESDDATDVIQDLPEDRKEKVLAELESAEQASDIASLLSYEEDTAGGLMAKEFIQANINWTVKECLNELRTQATEIDHVYTIYVVDDQDKLEGVLSLKTFLYADDSTKIGDICNTNVISVTTDVDEEEVANIMEKYDLIAIPVLNEAGVLLGRITLDDIVEVIKEEAEKDFQLASGISEKVESKDSVIQITRARLPWLLVGLVGGICGALVIGGFEGQLAKFPKLAFFIPLIAAMGGNVGVQSSAIIVQGLANNSLSVETTGSKLMKELGVGLLNGIILSLIIFLYNMVIGEDYALCWTVSLSLLVVIVFAGIFGAFVPLILDKYKIDPALATGPFITTMNDVIGLLLYFLIGYSIYL